MCMFFHARDCDMVAMTSQFQSQGNVVLMVATGPPGHEQNLQGALAIPVKVAKRVRCPRLCVVCQIQMQHIKCEPNSQQQSPTDK